ncbi:MAG: hypothetical protein UZ13_03511 [Chloroflexi bacterium OLB13]|nr:MAG: hypothetical protein UZ13_03511 [Chloroflexi bacterium OLB13]
MLPLELHPELPGEEGELIGDRVENERQRLADAVSNARLDMQQDRRVAALRRLHRRRELVRVRRHNAVVVRSGRDQRGWIMTPGLMLCSGEYAFSHAYCSGSSLLPYSPIHNRPIVKYW